MYRFYLSLFFLLFYIFIFVFHYKKHRDIFHPLCFFVILSILRYVPSCFSAEEDNYVIIHEDGIIDFVFYTALYTICVILGYTFYNTQKNLNKGYRFEGRINDKMFNLGFILFCVGVVSRIWFIQSSGGLSYILSNIQNKVEMVTGNGYLLAVGNFMTYGVVLMLCSDFYKQNKGLKMNCLLLACIGVSFFLFAFMSDRTAPMRFLMIIIMAYHYSYHRIKIKTLLSFKYLAIIFSCALFIVAMPLLRNKDGFDKYGNVSNLVESASEEISDVLYWFSYTGRDVFVYQHFNSDNYWFGKNILNFLSAPIPASLIGNKPPVDEGYYLSNLIMGYQSEPPANKFNYESSIPFDTPGAMFANFGIIGLILGGLIVGYAYGATYKLLRLNNFHPLVIVLSQIVLYNFSLTSHDMVNVLLLSGFMILPLMFTGNLRIRYR